MQPMASSSNPDGSFAKRTSTLPSDDGSRPFVFRNAGEGCVVAMEADKPFPGKAADWSWIFNAAGESHWKWYKRAGFSMQRTNRDYWKLLIPGVGQRRPSRICCSSRCLPSSSGRSITCCSTALGGCICS